MKHSEGEDRLKLVEANHYPHIALSLDETGL